MLSDSKLRSLKPAEKMYRITDSDGLCLEIKPTGKKFWRYRYRYLGVPKMLKLGQYPLVGLAEARKKRDEAKVLLADHINPTTHRSEKKSRSEKYSYKYF
jgi:hypothetical protein